MKTISLNEMIQDCLVILLGNLCIAVAVAFFVIPNKLLVGGTAGIAVALNAFWNIPEEVVINVLIYSLFIAGTIVLGKQFFLKTIVSTIVYPVLLAMAGDLYDIIPKHMIQMDNLYRASGWFWDWGRIPQKCKYRWN